MKSQHDLADPQISPHRILADLPHRRAGGVESVEQHHSLSADRRHQYSRAGGDPQQRLQRGAPRRRARPPFGEPYGSLILSLSVVILEVSLISALMATGDAAPALMRDTLYSIIMIVSAGWSVSRCCSAGASSPPSTSARAVLNSI